MILGIAGDADKGGPRPVQPNDAAPLASREVREIVDPDVARARWQGVPRREQDRVVALARRGQPHPDPEVAAAAVGWARAVLGPPERRRRNTPARIAVAVLSAVMEGGGPGSIYNGDTEWDGLPAVRKAAVLVEAANGPTASG